MRLRPLRFHPLLAGARPFDRLFACIGAFAAIALVAVSSAAALASVTPIWLVAPIGASAVLVFAVPASPLAQPWPVIGGNILSALVGVAVANTIGSAGFAAAMAVGLAIAIMTIARCLHPPGGAAALTAVIGGPSVYTLGWGLPFVAAVGLNSILLVIVGMAFHRFSSHSYPHRIAGESRGLVSADAKQLETADIKAVLDELGESFDIDIEDLAIIVRAVERRAATREERSAISGPQTKIRRAA